MRTCLDVPENYPRYIRAEPTRVRFSAQRLAIAKGHVPAPFLYSLARSLARSPHGMPIRLCIGPSRRPHDLARHARSWGRPGVRGVRAGRGQSQSRRASVASDRAGPLRGSVAASRACSDWRLQQRTARCPSSDPAALHPRLARSWRRSAGRVEVPTPKAHAPGAGHRWRRRRVGGGRREGGEGGGRGKGEPRSPPPA